MGVRSLEPLTTMVSVMVVINATHAPIILLWYAIDANGLDAVLMPFTVEVGYGQLAWSLLTTIMFSVWIYRAGTNLIEAGFDDLEFTPASRIWWHAVPIANLFVPYQGMREMWNASYRRHIYDAGNGLVSSWWALWLISTIFGGILNVAAGPEGPSIQLSWILCAVEAALAITAIMMIRAISAAQNNLSAEALDEVFA